MVRNPWGATREGSNGGFWWKRVGFNPWGGTHAGATHGLQRV